MAVHLSVRCDSPQLPLATNGYLQAFPSNFPNYGSVSLRRLPSGYLTLSTILYAAIQLAAAESQASARADAWQRTQAERVREAAARLRRARLRHATASRDGIVRSTGAGVVRRIETRALGPDRTEVRVVLVSDRSTSS